jgi:hypothetical protein
MRAEYLLVRQWTSRNECPPPPPADGVSRYGVFEHIGLSRVFSNAQVYMFMYLYLSFAIATCDLIEVSLLLFYYYLPVCSKALSLGVFFLTYSLLTYVTLSKQLGEEVPSLGHRDHQTSLPWTSSCGGTSRPWYTKPQWKHRKNWLLGS